MRATAFLLAATVLATSAPAQQSAPRYLSQRDVAEAARQHQALVAEFGGAETGARAAYVDSVGRRVAGYSGVVSSTYRFTTLNSAVENAFAVPGGYVYITRQLMGLMGDEAELGFVLGHETGHIAARHSEQRQSAARRNSVLGVLGVLLGSVVGGGSGLGNLIAQGAQQASQMATLRFSREQEYQADQLGVRYITAAGYDPSAATTMLTALSRATALESRIQGNANRSLPEWAQTHPNSQSRVQQASVFARQTGRAGTGLRNRDAFLAQLDGVFVDDDPAQGVIDGRSFTHPILRLQFIMPAGYRMQNGTRAVTIAGTSGQAQFSGGRFNGDYGSYVGQVINQLTGGRAQIAMGPLQQTDVNGLPAAYTVGRAATSSGTIDVGVMVYRFDADTAYHFVTLTRGGQGMSPFSAMLNSMRRISPSEASAIRPRVIDVVTVGRGDTVQSLASRMAYRDYKVERFMSLNGLTGNALVPGQKVKLIVYGTRRS